MKIKIIGILFIMNLGLMAQSFDPGNYFSNTSLNYNPAAAGMDDVFTILMNYQNQWMGFDGAPTIASLSFHAPSLKTNTAFGANFDSYRKGNQNYVSVNANYAYRIHWEAMTISMGLRAAVVSYSESELYLGGGNNDPLFAEDPSYLIPNFGVGFIVNAENYFVGFSIPYLLGYSHNDRSITSEFTSTSYYFTGGYTYRVLPILKLHPAVMFKYRAKVGSQIHLNLINATVYDKYMLGFNYIVSKNIEDSKISSYSVLAKLRANPQTDIGVAYEFNGGDIANYSNGSLEVFMQYKFRYKLNVSSPRNF